MNDNGKMDFISYNSSVSIDNEPKLSTAYRELNGIVFSLTEWE